MLEHGETVLRADPQLGRKGHQRLLGFQARMTLAAGTIDDRKLDGPSTTA
jgi:hypothetical protein